LAEKHGRLADAHDVDGGEGVAVLDVAAVAVFVDLDVDDTSVDDGKKSGGGSTGGLSHLEKQGLRACDKVQSDCSIAGLK
jgi:hypothetical protein